MTAIFDVTAPELLGSAALAVFLLGQVLDWGAVEPAGRRLTGLSWVLFAGFWVTMVPTFLFEMHSVVETVLSVLVIPVCLFAAVSVWRGREGVVLLTRAIGITGFVYSVALLHGVQEFLIETVATQTAAGIHALGYEAARQRSPDGFYSQFVFTDADGHEYVTFIVLACTGIGAIATFTGIVAAVRAPLRRKLRALVVAVGLVWLLNVVRNVFIAVAFGDQWFQARPFVSLAQAAGYSDPALASFFVADRVLSQLLSVVAILGIAALVLRLLPETSRLFEAALYLLTGRRYAIDVDRFTLERRESPERA